MFVCKFININIYLYYSHSPDQQEAIQLPNCNICCSKSADLPFKKHRLVAMSPQTTSTPEPIRITIFPTGSLKDTSNHTNQYFRFLSDARKNNILLICLPGTPNNQFKMDGNGETQPFPMVSALESSSN